MPDVITGGGALGLVDVKDAIASFAIDITDFLLDVSFLGVDIHLDVSGGGDLAAIVEQHVTRAIAISGGGDILVAGHKQGQGRVSLTTGGSTVGTGDKHALGTFDLTGAGGLWGPFPWVINPEVTILNGGLPNSDGSVGRAIKVISPGASSDNDSAVSRVALVGGPSLDDLTTTRTGS